MIAKSINFEIYKFQVFTILMMLGEDSYLPVKLSLSCVCVCVNLFMYEEDLVMIRDSSKL